MVKTDTSHCYYVHFLDFECGGIRLAVV
ncbi:hypothetical protein BRAO375_960060 [Bradyrhizobium sp. ORS 375]|nr:hypothetical protein BRAO375_960060 [Bradyrhizobium sp. ORS 375]